MKKIAVSDITLFAIGEEKKTLTFRERLNIAAAIDSCGFDAIELPALLNNKENAVVYRTVATSVENAEVKVSVNSVEEVEAAWNSVKDAKSAAIQVVVPVSTVQMEYQYHLKSAKMLDRISAICNEAKKYTANVEVVLKDATRSEDGFVVECVKKAQEAGANAVTVVDDAGIFFPNEFATLVKDIKNVSDITVYVQPSDALKMAAACAVEAIKAGADGVKTSTTGEWLKADVLADIFRARGVELRAESGLDVTKLHKTVDDINKQGDALVEINIEHKMIAGLDANSTIDDIKSAAQMLGYELSSEDNGKVFEEFKRVCAKRGAIGARELEAIIATSAMQVPSTYHLVNYVVNNGNAITATASIILEKEGERLSGVATGDGPIDASFHAIEQIIGHHYELDDFKVESVTKGREAVGSSIIRLRADGKLYSGNGVSTDIIGACIRAYVNALNKIVYEEN